MRSRLEEPDVVSLARRRLLRALAVLGGTGAAFQSLLAVGCGLGAPREEEGTVRVPLSGLRPGEPLQVDVAGRPVELRRTADGVSARSLSCTHWGCHVRWDPADKVYRCPCHHGVFDENGVVLSGPPPRPLPSVPVTIVDGSVVLRPSALSPSPSPPPSPSPTAA